MWSFPQRMSLLFMPIYLISCIFLSLPRSMSCILIADLHFYSFTLDIRFFSLFFYLFICLSLHIHFLSLFLPSWLIYLGFFIYWSFLFFYYWLFILYSFFCIFIMFISCVYLPSLIPLFHYLFLLYVSGRLSINLFSFYYLFFFVCLFIIPSFFIYLFFSMF